MVLASDGRPIRVGALYSQTGPTAYVERTQLNATLLAIDEINRAGGVGGAEVAAVTYDARSDPETFRALAERMIEEDGVALVIGCYMSHTRQAVVPVVERCNAVLAYTAPYEGFEYSPNVIYGGAVPNQHSLLLARHLTAAGARRFYLVGTRYAFPIEANRVMMSLVAERGGQTLAERYVALQATRPDLAAIVADIKAKRPDVVFCTVVGEAAAAFFRLCREAGIGRETVFASLTMTEAEVDLIGADLLDGQLTAATYFESLQTPANRHFVHSYRARYGDRTHVNAMAETAYGLTHMALAAAGACGSFNARLLRAELANRTFQAPQGLIRLDPDNSHFYLWPRIARVRADGQFEILEQSATPVKPDPYLIQHSLADWDRPPPAADPDDLGPQRA